MRLVICALLLSVASFAQTSDDLKTRYTPVQVYAMRPNVWLAAEFAADGQVCTLSLDKHDRSAFSTNEIDELTAELVPLAARGAESKWLGDLSVVTGASFSAEHVYENVTITEYGTGDGDVVRLVIRWKSRPCRKS